MTEYVDPDGNEITIDEFIKLSAKRRGGGDDSWWRKRTEVNGAVVSTVWLGINHNFSDEGPPIAWETMIFYDPDYEDWQWRYETREEAFAAHDRIVAKLIEGSLRDEEDAP